jgi:hypothetical protein
MRHHRDAAARDAMDAHQYLAPLLCHHDQRRGPARKAFDDRALIGIGLLEHGMERHDHGRLHPIEQFQQMRAGRAAENAIFVLHEHEIGTAFVDALGGDPIVGDILLRDLTGHLGPVIVNAIRVVHRIMIDGDVRVDMLDRIANIAGEGGDATEARRAIADESYASNGAATGRFFHMPLACSALYSGRS